MAGPELRYYIPASAKAKIWVAGNGSFGSVKSKYTGEADDDPTKLSRFGGGAGLAFFPNSNISIDLGLGSGVFIAKNETTDFNNNKVTNKDTSSGISLELGFTIYL